MKIDASTIRALFVDSSLSKFFSETDLFYIDFPSKTACSCYTLRYFGYDDDDLLNMASGALPVHFADKERADMFIRRLIGKRGGQRHRHI